MWLLPRLGMSEPESEKYKIYILDKIVVSRLFLSFLFTNGRLNSLVCASLFTFASQPYFILFRLLHFSVYDTAFTSVIGSGFNYPVTVFSPLGNFVFP